MNVNIRIDTSRLRIPQVKEEFLRKLAIEMRTTGLEIETDAKMKITNDGHVDTGRLRASIHMEYKGNTSYSYADDNGNSFNGSLKGRIRNELDVIIGTNVVYAKKIERLDSYLFTPFERSKSGFVRRIRNIINSL